MKGIHWLIRDRGAELRVDLGFPAHEGPQVRERTREHVDALLWRGLHTGDASIRGALESIHRQLRGTPAPGSSPSVHTPDFERALARDLRFAASSGWLSIARIEPTRGGGGPRSSPADEPARLPELAPDAWVAIELVDEDGHAVPNAEYRIECSDGRVRTGTTNASGKARAEGLHPGSCTVSFPRLHAPDWKKVG